MSCLITTQADRYRNREQIEQASQNNRIKAKAESRDFTHKIPEEEEEDPKRLLLGRIFT